MTRLLCWMLGHRRIVVASRQNEQSTYGGFMCSRAGCVWMEHWQWDVP